MQNLAGNPNSTAICALELQRAGVPIALASEDEHLGEVGSRVVGRLGAFTFERLRYYWAVRGPLPLEAAVRVYADPIGRRDVRVAGHCGCPPPESPWVEWRRPDGARVVDDPSGKQQAEWDAYVVRHPRDDDGEPVVFSRDPAADGARPFVTLYHVDSAEGLALLVAEIRALDSALVTCDLARCRI